MAKLLIFAVLFVLLAPAIVHAADSQTCSGAELDADVLILGGGIAGVAAAKTLHDRGVTNLRMTLYEYHYVTTKPCPGA